jgi:hypothetical protein
MRASIILVPRSFIVALLASLYVLAFIISPYWMIYPSATNFLILALTIGAGAIWVYYSSADLQVQFDPKVWIAFTILLLGMVLLNYRAITSAIPWRGDEEYHIKITLELVNKMKFTGISWKWLAIPPVIFALFLFAAWQKSKWAIVTGGGLLVATIVFLIYKNPFPGEGSNLFLRYPFVNYWFYALAPKAAIFFKADPYQEALYRIVPILFAAATASIFLRTLTSKKITTGLLWALCAATIPLLFYYSSILYLELPAVFLMTLVCANITTLLRNDPAELRQTPAWYALILIGFIKETSISFLLCFLMCRIAVSLQTRLQNGLHREPALPLKGNRKQPFIHYLSGELLIIFSTLFPILFYLFFRNALTSTRSFVPQLSNLWNPVVYPTIGRSFVEQFGIFLLFFLGGCIVLVSKKEYTSVCFFLLTFFAIPLFHVVDDITFAGYGRFNLFVFPAILAGASVFIKQIVEHRKFTGMALACVALSVNFLISPVYLDGTKKPLWGDYLSDISEHYYPYPEAFSWLKKTHQGERILFAGLDYPYYFDFYFHQLDWHPEYEIFDTSHATENLPTILVEAEMKGFSVVVYHAPGKNVPLLSDASHFQQERIIRNDAHLLIVYSKTRDAR